MAKAKSKKIMLEDALVPVDEQPYQIPENWCWTRIKHVSDVVTGSTPSKKLVLCQDLAQVKMRNLSSS